MIEFDGSRIKFFLTLVMWFVSYWFIGTTLYVILMNFDNYNKHVTVWEMIPRQVEAVMEIAKIIFHSIAGW